MTESSLAPGLLLSMPHLADPNFTRAVVLMIEHDDDGSFGLIVNQPSDVLLTSLLAPMEIDWAGDPAAAVWSGGPVVPSSGWLLHEPTAPENALAADLKAGIEDGDSILVCPGIALSTSPKLLQQISGDPPRRTRFLLGYSGWGPGQLAAEMASGSWLHAEALPSIVFDTAPDEMWEAALRSIGVNPESIIQSRGVH